MHAECSLTGRCECLEGYFRRGEECSPLLGPQEPCTDTAQCVAMAECLADDSGQKACRCAEGYFSLDGACHLLKLPDDKCSGGGTFHKRFFQSSGAVWT